MSIIRCLTCPHLIYKYYIYLYKYLTFTITTSFPTQTPPQVVLITTEYVFPSPNHNVANNLLAYISRTPSFMYSPHEYAYTLILFAALCARIYRRYTTSLYRFRLTLPLSTLYPHNLVLHIVSFGNNYLLSCTLSMNLLAPISLVNNIYIYIYRNTIYIYVYAYISYTYS